MEKLEALCISGRNIKYGAPAMKMVWLSLKNLNIELPYNLTIPFLDIYPKELKVGTHEDICIPMSKAMLFTILSDKWINIR